MKIFINRILISCVIFIATALIVSCGKPPGAVVETLPTEKQNQKPSKAELTKQRAEQGFSELRAETELRPRQRAEGWVDAIGECYQGPNMTTEQARQYALEKAKRNAIEQMLGAEVKAQTLRFKSETLQDFYQSFTELSQTSLYGKIVEQKKPVWKLENVQLPGEPPIPLHRVFLRVKVAKEKGEPDPSFKVSLKLNDGKETFLEGDEMILHVTSSKDCYITVFNVLSDNTVLILFPPQGQKSKKVFSSKTLSIPSETERRQGLRFRVGLMPGKTEDTESVIVVATKDNIPFLPKKTKKFRPDIAILSGKVVLPTYQSALEEINRWMVSIPLSQRAFDMQQYHIRKK